MSKRAEERSKLREKPRKWEKVKSPKEERFGDGWVRQMDRAFKDGRYAVMIRTVETSWGKVEHACIRNVMSTDIPWIEKQKIKDELFGPDRMAVEIFPAACDLVDAANMYHLWVFPIDKKLPFGLK